MSTKKKGGGGDSVYAPASLNPLLKNRKTTMPALTGPADPQRPAAGPPAEPVEAQLQRLLTFDPGPLHLLGLVTQQQSAEDRVAWFQQAPEYVERTAIMQDAAPMQYKDIPWTGKDLLNRLRRVKAGLRCTDELVKVLRLILSTLRAEQADLVAMTDIVVVETELAMARPTQDETTRSQLKLLSAFPVQIWTDRQAEIQGLKAANKQQKDALDQLLAQIDDADGQDPAPVTVSVPPAGGQNGTVGKVQVGGQPASKRRLPRSQTQQAPKGKSKGKTTSST